MPSDIIDGQAMVRRNKISGEQNIILRCKGNDGSLEFFFLDVEWSKIFFLREEKNSQSEASKF